MKKAHKYYNLIQNSVKFAILKRNDMQDNGLLENGSFTKCFQKMEIIETLNEIIDLVSYSIEGLDITIK
jgi:hypothetical protein